MAVVDAEEVGRVCRSLRAGLGVAAPWRRAGPDVTVACV